MNMILELKAVAAEEIRQRLEPETGLYLTPLIERMGQGRRAGRANVFAVTAVKRGRGASHVTRLAAQELARTYRSDVLVVTLEDLLRMPYPPRLGDANLLHEWSPRAWGLVNAALLKHPCAIERMAIRVSELRQWGGGFVLIDCPSLEEGAGTMPAAAQTDGTVLTVAAGESERAEVQSAVRSFRNTGTELLGMVLNKRTYAIPQSIYRWL